MQGSDWLIPQPVAEKSQRVVEISQRVVGFHNALWQYVMALMACDRRMLRITWVMRRTNISIQRNAYSIQFSLKPYDTSAIGL